MNSSRVWTIAAVLLIAALLVGTWFIGVAPRLNDARDADAAREQAISLNAIHQQTLAQLQAEFDDTENLTRELEQLRDVVPEFPEASAFIRTIGEIALQRGVGVHQLTLGDPAPYIPPMIADEELTAVAGNLAQGGLYVMTIGISISGTEQAMLDFVSTLQQATRYTLVHGLSFVTEPGSPTSGSVQAQIFGLSEATIPAAPSATPSAAPEAPTE